MTKKLRLHTQLRLKHRDTFWKLDPNTDRAVPSKETLEEVERQAEQICQFLQDKVPVYIVRKFMGKFLASHPQYRNE